MTFKLSKKYYLGTTPYMYTGEGGGLLCFTDLVTGLEYCYIESLELPAFKESPSAKGK